MAKLIELRIDAKYFYELLGDIQAKRDFKPVDVIRATYYADRIEAGPSGYKLPVVLLRRHKVSHEDLQLEGSVTVPYSMCLSIVEFDDGEPREHDRSGMIGFQVDKQNTDADLQSRQNRHYGNLA